MSSEHAAHEQAEAPPPPSVAIEAAPRVIDPIDKYSAFIVRVRVLKVLNVRHSSVSM